MQRSGGYLPGGQLATAHALSARLDLSTFFNLRWKKQAPGESGAPCQPPSANR